MRRPALFLFAALLGLGACQSGGDAPTTPAPAADEPEASGPARAVSPAGSDGDIPLTIQETHPNGTQLQISAVRYDDAGTAIDLVVVNNYDQRVELNGRNMMLVDDLGNEYAVVPPADNEDVEVLAGDRLEGTFNFGGRVAPEANSLTLVTNESLGSETSTTSNHPVFRIGLPLDR